MTPGRLLFSGDETAIARTNLWLRAGERVLIHMGSFPATDFGVLFDGVAALPWERWLPRDAEFPVQWPLAQFAALERAGVPADREAGDRQAAAGGPSHRDTAGDRARCASIEVSLRDDVAMLTLDTTGVGLHKRGYRRLVGEAQLRETLAAVLVQLSFWRPGACSPIRSAARARSRSKRRSSAATSHRD